MDKIIIVILNYVLHKLHHEPKIPDLIYVLYSSSRYKISIYFDVDKSLGFFTKYLVDFDLVHRNYF